MDVNGIKALLEKRLAEQQALVAEINALGNEMNALSEKRQTRLQDALRLAGAIQILKELVEADNGKNAH